MVGCYVVGPTWNIQRGLTEIRFDLTVRQYEKKGSIFINDLDLSYHSQSLPFLHSVFNMVSDRTSIVFPTLFLCFFPTCFSWEGFPPQKKTFQIYDSLTPPISYRTVGLPGFSQVFLILLRPLYLICPSLAVA